MKPAWVVQVKPVGSRRWLLASIHETLRAALYACGELPEENPDCRVVKYRPMRRDDRESKLLGLLLRAHKWTDHAHDCLRRQGGQEGECDCNHSDPELWLEIEALGLTQNPNPASHPLEDLKEKRP